MGMLATSEAQEPVASAPGAAIAMQRANIVDREGRILATNLDTYSVYAQPPLMIDPIAAADQLVAIFPDLDKERLVKDFTGKRKFLWIKKRISPEQKQAVHDIGDPGILFGPRVKCAFIPTASLAAHILGGSGFGREGVSAAEVIGVAGVEKQFDDYLRDPANGNKPLQLSLDLTIQAAVEQVLYGGMKIMNAKGSLGGLDERAHTGEVVSAASLPSFDPNDRPRPPTSGFDPSDSPLFNRYVQGVYELGSVFKIFTAAQAVQLGLVNSNTIIDTSGPMKIGRFPIGEFNGKNYGKISVADVIVHSSNRGTGRLALQIGAQRQQDFLNTLGMFDPTPFEIVEAKGGVPLKPKKWGELSTVTISYGHGLSTKPDASGGRVRSHCQWRSTMSARRSCGKTALSTGPRVMSESAAAQAQNMLRKVVTDGTSQLWRGRWL